jgi:ubiquinone biosynthesis protein UbiJ
MNLPAMPPLSLPFAATINHLLAQEPWARQALAVHAGKLACIDAGVAVLRLRVLGDGFIEAAGGDGAAADMTIRIRSADLAALLQNRERAFSYVKIEGDAEFANTISQLSKTLRWDAAHDLEKVMGPIAAARVAGGAASLFAATVASQRKLAENVAEFLLDERPVLVRPALVEELGAGVTRLRDDVERAAKRLEKLEQKLAQKTAAAPHTVSTLGPR